MNEAHFKFFLLYMIDLHNLHIENKVSSVANPLNKNRKLDILASKPELGEKAVETDEQSGVETLSDMVKMIDIGAENQELDKSKNTHTQFEDCFFVDKEGVMHCKFCEGKYKRDGHMKNHVELKHNMIIDLLCKCGQDFDDT